MPISRLIFVVAGCLAVGWGASTLPTFWQSHDLEYVAARVLAGAPYTIASLGDLLPKIEALETERACAPRALQAAAVIDLHIWEQSLAPDQLSRLDQRANALNSAVRRSLACAPADPFLWMVLYSVESARTGFRSDYVDFIRQSYRLGPHEAWISVKRNRAVLAIHPALPADLQLIAVGEFGELVQNQLYEEAADNLLGPGWPIREQLLARLETVDQSARVAFASALYARGADLRVPGVTAPGQRPWLW